MVNPSDKYVCEKCGEKFRLKVVYEKHLRDHKPRKKYVRW
jgi:hypothetical protein